MLKKIKIVYTTFEVLKISATLKKCRKLAKIGVKVLNPG